MAEPIVTEEEMQKTRVYLERRVAFNEAMELVLNEDPNLVAPLVVLHRCPNCQKPQCMALDVERDERWGAAKLLRFMAFIWEQCMEDCYECKEVREEQRE